MLSRRRAVEKLGATLAVNEIDQLGRGENVVYRLTAQQYRGGAA